MRSFAAVAGAIGVLIAAERAVDAQKAYGPGVTDTEIKLGQTMPYSGPASPYGVVGRVQAAYFKMLNEHGGVNGRKINLISLDDAYSPPKTVEQIRRLVEDDKVFAIFGLLGTPPNIAVAKYLNTRQVPDLLASTGSALLDDPKNLPWTTIFSMPQRTEAHILIDYILKTRPDAKIGILYQNDEYGKGYLKFFKEALGEKAASMIVKEVSYDLTDPTIDSQIVTLQGSGADTLLEASTPRFSGQAIRKVAEIGWKPMHVIIYSASSVNSAMKPAGLQNGVGVLTTEYFKMPDDPALANDPAAQGYFEFMKKYAPEEPATDASPMIGYIMAGVMADILKNCGDDLTRENLLKQANSFDNTPVSLLVDGVHYTTTPEDHTPFREARMYRFDGARWVGFGEVIKVSLPR